MAAIGLLFATLSASACSDICLPKSEGQPVVSARTMDFNFATWSYYVCSPRGYKYTGMTPNGLDGMTWENKYGFIGLDGINLPSIENLTKEMYCDGMNEEGLSAALLWMDGAMTPTPAKKDHLKVMCQMNIVGWVLGNCANVQDVIDKFNQDPPEILLWMFRPLEELPLPLHLVVHDKNNDTVILEWLSDKTFRPVITTGSDYTYCTTNDSVEDDSAYVECNPILKKLSAADPFNPASGTFNVGGGSVALPGDSDSLSRWIMGSFTMKNATLTEPYPCSAPWRVIQTFHSIGHLNTIYGEFQDPECDTLLTSPFWYTSWGMVRDHSNRIIYYYSSRNQQLQKINLSDYKEHMESGKNILKICPIMTVFVDPEPSNPAPISGIKSAIGGDLLSVAIPPPLENGGRIFIFARMADGAVKLWNGTKWSLSPLTSKDCPSVAENLFKGGTLDVPLGSNSNVWKGSEFYAGRGANFTEMHIGGRSEKIGSK